MEWPQLLLGAFGAFGFGAIAVKLLDILWLQKLAERSEKQRWLREKRFQVYNALVKKLLQDPLWTDHRSQESLDLAADAMLLAGNRRLGVELASFFRDRSTTAHRLRPQVPSALGGRRRQKCS